MYLSINISSLQLVNMGGNLDSNNTLFYHALITR